MKRVSVSIPKKVVNTLSLGIKVVGTYLFLLVVVAGECVGQGLQGGVRIASEGRHYSDQDHTFGQADDQSWECEAHHAAQVDPPWAKVANQTTHDQGEEGWGSTLQEQAQTSHTDTCKKKKKKLYYSQLSP